jgi:Arc/MetJ-type ribon-helix-helix transcriptional regulator
MEGGFMLAVKEKKKRFNVFLDPAQYDFLISVKKERRTSASEIIRELVDDFQKQHYKSALKSAALSLMDDYKTNKELTVFTSLDGEKFL